MRTPILTENEKMFMIENPDVVETIVNETLSDKAFYAEVATNIHSELNGFVFGISENDGDAEYFGCDIETSRNIFALCGFKKCNDIFVTLNMKANRKQSTIIRNCGNYIRSIPIDELEYLYKYAGYNPNKFNAGIASEIAFNGYFNSSPSLNDFDGVQMKVSLSRNYTYNGKTGKSSGQSDILVMQVIKEFNGKIYRLANSNTILKSDDFHEITIKYHHNKKIGDYVIEYVPHNRQFKSNWEKHKTETLLYVPID